jgi:hypothetical protein
LIHKKVASGALEAGDRLDVPGEWQEIEGRKRVEA